MKIVSYAEGGTESGDRMLQKIEGQVPPGIFAMYRSFDDFKKELLQHDRKPNAAVLMAADAAELERILTLDKLLADMRILLVLPDRCKKNAAAGHRLRPRYISYTDSDFEDVVAVVKQILKLSTAPKSEKSKKTIIHALS